MPVAQGLVGNQQNADGPSPVTERLGSFGELIVSNFNGFYFEQTQRGNGYVATSAAASIVALGNGNPTLFNPSDSGRLAILTRVAIGSATVGTPVMTTLQYGWEASMGAFAANSTGSPILTFTTVASTNLLIGSPKTSKMKFSGVTNSFTTAPAVLGNSGFSASATVSGFGNQIDDIHGRICLLPGTIFQVGATTATSTAIAVSIYWLEVPIPALAA